MRYGELKRLLGDNLMAEDLEVTVDTSKYNTCFYCPFTSDMYIKRCTLTGKENWNGSNYIKVCEEYDEWQA